MRLTTWCARSSSWNPVKELKVPLLALAISSLPASAVESGEGIERLQLIIIKCLSWETWNPVKELKDDAARSVDDVQCVESGEGIERFIPD